MNLGQKINELINTNIKIWHKDTLVRTNSKISRVEKAKLFLEARILNTQRSEVRDDIDNTLGEETCSRKVGYYGTSRT
jgi:hypothetical protein